MINVKLKENLKRKMEERHLRLTDLAKLSSVPKQRISDWLAGAIVRNLDQLKQVATVLETSVDELLFTDVIHGESKLPVIGKIVDVEEVYEVRVRKLNKNSK